MAGRSDKGFTLIETLIVIVILGVLAAVVTLAVTGLSSEGEASAALADRKTVIKAEEAFFTQSGSDSRVYASEADLAGRGFLATLSTLHDICLSPDKKAYEVVAAGTNCATVVFP